MVNVVVLGSASHPKGFRIDGHADFAPHGEDVVCAGVSVLGYTTINALTDLLHCEDYLDYDIHEGSMVLKVDFHRIGDDTKPMVAFLFQTFDLGIRSMVASYPQYVHITYEEV